MLYGRGFESGRLEALFADAASGRGGALVVRGDPGMGKSALLADATSRVPDALVLWTQGMESESPLAFAALHRLVRPVVGLLDRLPEAQAGALRVALGEGNGRAADRFVVFIATLSLLAEAAESQFVIVVVDDAHWLDAASADALLFVARRLQSDRIALVFAARDGDVRQFDSSGLDEITLQGIDATAAGELLAEQAGRPVSGQVRDALVANTGGNPLALVELPTALTDAQLSGEARLPAQLPLTARVERTFLDRCRRLSMGAQTLLLVAASDDSGRVATIRSAAETLGAEAPALAEAERSGLVRVSGTQLQLRHPLVRSVVYGAATLIERQQAHRALATTLDAVGDGDRRVWHLALATDGPDEAIATELDGVAERSRHRGGHEAASAAAERAAELSALQEARARRLQAAAMSAWMSGHPGRARLLADDARRSTADPILGADVGRLSARLEWNVGSATAGHRIVMSAAHDVASYDTVRALEMAMLGTALATYGGHSHLTEVEADGFPPALPSEAPARLRCLEALLAGQQHLLAGRMRQAAEELRRAFSLGDASGEDVDLLTNLGLAAFHLGEYDEMQRDFSQLLEIARSRGDVSLMVVALSRLPLAELGAGNWDAAGVASEEALTLAQATGQPALTALPLAWRALLATLRGSAGGSEALAELDGLLAREPVGIGAVAVRDAALWAKGIGAGTRSDSAAALHHLSRLSLPGMQRLAAIDRVEAAAQADHPETVEAWADELESFAEATDSAAAAAAAWHGRGLISEGETAAAHFETALALHTRAPRVFALARTRLAYGAFLRRSGRRVNARPQLRAALEVFDDLGATAWAERASRELRASGETARRRDPSTTLLLTPQEQQIARLVSQGLSNRDVAGRLFVSPRTVEYHLSHAYEKLGVRSRGELVGLSLG